MKKIYEKNELLFAIVWIVVYCLVSIPVRGSLGDESMAMLAGLAVIAAGILIFVKRFHLEQTYGLIKWSGSAKDYLYFLPESLPEEFTSMDLARCARIPRDTAQTCLLILRDLGIIELIGKKGRFHLHRIAI